MRPAPELPAAGERRRLYLRASVKLLVGVGLAFLLVPFLKSLPRPQTKIPTEATVLAQDSLAPGQTQYVVLSNGTAVYVTRSSAAQKQALRRFPAALLWYPSPPGLAEQDWFVLHAASALDEPVQYLPARGTWPGGFVAPGGAAWDVAGRALKPWPGHPTGHALKAQNLLPMPFTTRDGALVLLPWPAQGVAGNDLPSLPP